MTITTPTIRTALPGHPGWCDAIAPDEEEWLAGESGRMIRQHGIHIGQVSTGPGADEQLINVNVVARETVVLGTASSTLGAVAVTVYGELDSVTPELANRLAAVILSASSKARQLNTEVGK